MRRNPRFPNGNAQKQPMRRASPHDSLDATGSPTTTVSAERPLASAIVPNEALYRSLIERVPGIVYISQFGPDARWHYVSPQIQEYLGYTAEEWLALSFLFLGIADPKDTEPELSDLNTVRHTE